MQSIESGVDSSSLLPPQEEELSVLTWGRGESQLRPGDGEVDGQGGGDLGGDVPRLLPLLELPQRQFRAQMAPREEIQSGPKPFSPSPLQRDF